jgi:hypothetical protein
MNHSQKSRSKKIKIQFPASLKRELIERLAEEYSSRYSKPVRRNMAEAKIENLIPDMKAVAARELQRYAESLIDKNLEWLNMSPENLAKYSSAFSVEHDTSSITIKFYTTDWLIGAMEEGAGSFSIKEAMLRNVMPNENTGNRSRTIRIENSANGSGQNGKMPTVGSQIGTEIADTIIRTMKEGVNKDTKDYELSEGEETITVATETGNKRFFRKREGVKLKTTTNEGRSGGRTTERIETYTSKRAFAQGKKPIGVGYSSFKTISDKPGSAAWQHPGFPGNKIFDRTVEMCEAAVQELVEICIRKITE